MPQSTLFSDIRDLSLSFLLRYDATVDVAFCFLCYKAVKQGKIVIYDLGLQKLNL